MIILKGDLLRMVTEYEFNVDNSIAQYRKLMFQFSKEMNFVEKAASNRSNRDKSPLSCSNHQLSWLLGFPQKTLRNQKQDGCRLILLISVID